MRLSLMRRMKSLRSRGGSILGISIQIRGDVREVVVHFVLVSDLVKGKGYIRRSC